MEKSRTLPVTKLMFDENAVLPKAVRTSIGSPRPSPKAPFPQDSRLQSYDRTRQLLTGSRVEKKGEMLTGSLGAQVDGFISFLQSNDFLESPGEKSEG